MIKTISECVGCPPHMGCLYEACPYYEVTILECDECGAELDEGDCLYEYDGEELCKDCLCERFPKIKVD